MTTGVVEDGRKKENEGRRTWVENIEDFSEGREKKQPTNFSATTHNEIIEADGYEWLSTKIEMFQFLPFFFLWKSLDCSH